MLEFSLRPLAHYFAQKHAHRLRFLPRHQRWLRLDELSGFWRPDDGARLEDARELLNEAAGAAQNRNITSRGGAAALLRLAVETEPAMTATIPDHEIRPGLQGLAWGPV
jgi:hypothetical protein